MYFLSGFQSFEWLYHTIEFRSIYNGPYLGFKPTTPDSHDLNFRSKKKLSAIKNVMFSKNYAMS